MGKKYQHIVQSEQLEEKIKKILHQIYTDEDPQVITEYRKFFKKHVSFFSRTYVAAYMLKHFISGQNNTRTSFSRSPRTQSQETSSNNRTYSNIKRVSLNQGSNLISESDILAFLLSLPRMKEANIKFIKQTPRHTIITLDRQYVRDLLEGVKQQQLNGKKVYVDLRARI